MKRKEWFFIFLPLFFVWIIDHFSKIWMINSNQSFALGFFHLSLHYNQGAMLGLFANLPAFLRVVSVSTGGAFLVVTYALIQYLLPFKSLKMRIGLSILLGGILGNVTDRIIWGKVADFITLSITASTTPFFNLADVFQWIGFALIFWVVIKDGDKLWMEKNQRKLYWINPTFQLKYCYLLLSVGISMSLIAMVFSYTYLRVSLIEIVGQNPVVLNKFLTPFAITFLIVSIGFCLGLFTLGKIISHKIAGPVYAFEKYLIDLAEARDNNSSIRKFKLRSGDEFAELESIAQVIKTKFAAEIAEDLPHKESSLKN